MIIVEDGLQRLKNLLTPKKECAKCKQWEDDYAEAISYIAELEDELYAWDLEHLLECVQGYIVRKEEIPMEFKEKMRKINELVNVIYKYIDIKEKM